MTPALILPPERIPFMQAKYFTAAGRKAVDWLVIHSAETPETAGQADSLMRQCADGVKIRMPDGSLGEAKASWHYAVDADQVTQSVNEWDVAWQASGANRAGIGIELAGAASQDGAKWADFYSLRVLEHAGWLGAGICARWAIPAAFVDAKGLLEGRRGITTHAEVNAAFKQGDHTDPGPSFPMGFLLERISWWMDPMNARRAA